MQLSEALDRAKLTSGSDAATGRALDLTEAQVQDARKGRKPLPKRALDPLADLAHLSEQERLALWAARAGYAPRKPSSPSTTGSKVLTGIGAFALAVVAGAALSGLGLADAPASLARLSLYITSTAAAALALRAGRPCTR